MVKEIPPTYYGRDELLKFLQAYGFKNLKTITAAMKEDYEWRQ